MVFLVVGTLNRKKSMNINTCTNVPDTEEIMRNLHTMVKKSNNNKGHLLTINSI